MEITREQKRILIVTTIIIVLFFIFWIFIYAPSNNSVKILRAELMQVEDKIGAIETMIGGKDTPMEEGISMLRGQLKELDGKFPASEEETLKAISSIAYKSGLNVVSIKPQLKTLFLDENENIIQIENKRCQKLSVFMTVRSTYMKLGKFLEVLRTAIPYLLTVEKVHMIKKPIQHELETQINLTMYFLIEEK